MITSLRWFLDETWEHLPRVLVVAFGLGVVASLLIWSYTSKDARMASSGAAATTAARQFLEQLGTPA